MTMKPTKLLIMSATLVVVAGIIPVLAPGLMMGAWAIPTTMFIVAAPIFLLLSIVSGGQEQSVFESQKQKVKGQDMYQVINEFVAELDETERGYLRERLAIREQAHDREVSESLVSVQ